MPCTKNKASKSLVMVMMADARNILRLFFLLSGIDLLACEMQVKVTGVQMFTYRQTDRQTGPLRRNLTLEPQLHVEQRGKKKQLKLVKHMRKKKNAHASLKSTDM